MKVDLEHEDAPVLGKFTHGEFRELLTGFRTFASITERFPVKSRGCTAAGKARCYNGVFVGTFNALPRALVRRLRLASAGVLPEVVVRDSPSPIVDADTDQSARVRQRLPLSARANRSLGRRSKPAGPAACATAIGVSAATA